MAIFRVAKTRDYTVMSNYHLRDKNLTLKAKGLLSLILSLPEDWNYTTRGLAAICKEGVDSIGAALRELESAGYLTRHRLRDRSGRISDTEYVVYESPRTETEADMPDAYSPDKASQDTDEPDTASPCTENPYMVSPDTTTPRTDAPDTENPAQLNTQVSNTYEPNTQKSNPDPIIIQKQRAQQADTLLSKKNGFVHPSALPRSLQPCRHIPFHGRDLPQRRGRECALYSQSHPRKGNRMPLCIPE